MNSIAKTSALFELRRIKPIYLALLFLTSITGMAQMPIFKRYYIADIPGLGWLAQYYVTHYIHYVGAILLIALFTYLAIFYLAMMRKWFQLTPSAFIRIGLLLGIVVTGVFRVLKNLPNIVFSPGFTMFIDIAHLGFVILFLMAGGLFMLIKSRWLRAGTAD